MNAIELTDAVLNSFKAHFPNGYCRASKYALGGGIHFSFGLIGEIDDLSSGIRENDPLRLSFGILDGIVFGSPAEIEGKIVFEGSQSSISCLPDNPYMAMSSYKIPYRKINNVPEKALSSIDKFFAKVKAAVDDRAGGNFIYNQDKIPAKYL